MMLRTADSEAPMMVSLTSVHNAETLFTLAVNSPLEFFEKNVGLNRNNRAMIEFCTCSSMMCWIRMI